MDCCKRWGHPRSRRTVERSPFTGDEVAYPSGTIAFEVRIGADGPVVARDLEDPEPPHDRRAELARALETRNDESVLAALLALGLPKTDEDRAVLLLATKSASDRVITESIVMLGDGPDTRAQLSKAWADLSDAERARRMVLAREAFGPLFTL